MRRESSVEDGSMPCCTAYGNETIAGLVLLLYSVLQLSVSDVFPESIRVGRTTVIAILWYSFTGSYQSERV